MKPIGTEVNKLVYHIFKKSSPALAEIIINWDKIIGVKFSSKASPVKVSSRKESGKKINVLYVRAENSSISMEMSYHKELIIERIAVYLGYKAIHNIVFLL